MMATPRCHKKKQYVTKVGLLVIVRIEGGIFISLKNLLKEHERFPCNLKFEGGLSLL